MIPTIAAPQPPEPIPEPAVASGSDTAAARRRPASVFGFSSRHGKA